MNPLRDGNYTGKVESAIRFHLETWDVNCQQYIHKRFSERQITPGIEKLHSRALELETQLAALRDQADCQPDAGTGTLTLLGLAVMPVLGNPTRVSSRDAHH
ncbi:hypothetical protein Poly21_54570 [Allorhodopirellula heiligendammensis]|uniref:Uncharacterized protein n=1 Tax=Allorhodopirellula heiligendammensis TaxID=2714739 RepID=A0A5C6BE89_9BACT|nr:hypothetical protein Poly21_54570 [Allorhodopirellula heiligendammensis]